MTTSDLIQLGMLILAGLALAGTASVAAWSWLKRRHFVLRLGAKMADHVFYISSIAARKGSRPYVAAVARWCEVEFFNTGDEPVVLAGIAEYLSGSSPRKLKDFPVRHVELYLEGEKAAEAISLPLRIDAHDGLRFWILCRLPIEESLGRIMFELFGKEAQAIPKVQMLEHLETMERELKEHVKEEVKFAQVQEVSALLRSAQVCVQTCTPPSSDCVVASTPLSCW